MSETPAGAPSTDDPQKLAIEGVIVSEALCAALRIPAGARVLDIGCGTGHTAIAAARRRAAVRGIDVNEQALERARRRADAEGLEQVEFTKADALAMPFPDASFDYVLSTFGVVMIPDQEGAAREVARVARPGGVIALTALTPRSFPSQIYDLVHGLFKNPNAPKRPHYAWSEEARARELLGAYVKELRLTLGTYDTCFSSAAATFEHQIRWHAPIRMLLEKSPPALRQAFKEGYMDLLARTNEATDGTFMTKVEYATITATRAG